MQKRANWPGSILLKVFDRKRSIIGLLWQFAYYPFLQQVILLRKAVTKLASMLLIEGELDEHEYILSENASIGRSPSNDIVLKESKVSRQHASINFRDGHYVIVDLKSSNGIMVNNAKVEEVTLKDGDEVKVGSFEFQFNIL